MKKKSIHGQVQPVVMPWKRYRFWTAAEDYRPIKFPPPGPWWCSGSDFQDRSCIIVYLPSITNLLEYWPEAEEVEFTEESEIIFTDRFSKPDWWA